ncbi:MAG: nucleoside triphosphate pyrophosphohydrolase [Patescibacteria group bacterium]|jgi:predicted house-cleaning noncanonical NTP pyrophosphatase (MazG superfamily)
MPSKLVRDKIPSIIRAEGREPVTHIADEAEYRQRLKEKLQEEVDEFLEAENVEEMADVLEILDAVAEFKGFDREEIKKVRERKADERGIFKNRIILDTP